MTSLYSRVGTVALLLGAVCTQGQALEPKKWSKINNFSNKDYTFTITDFKVVVGDIYIKQADVKGDGLKLSSAKDSTILKGGTNYLCYYSTTGKALGLSFTLGDGANTTEINLKRLPIVGDRMVVSPKTNMKNSPLTISLGGFRNLAGPPFITINPVLLQSTDED